MAQTLEIWLHASSNILGSCPLHATSIIGLNVNYQFDWLSRHYAIVVEVLVLPPLRILISVSEDCCPFFRASWSEIISPVSWVSMEWTESRRVCWLFSQSWAFTMSSGNTVLWNIRITNLGSRERTVMMTTVITWIGLTRVFCITQYGLAGWSKVNQIAWQTMAKSQKNTKLRIMVSHCGQIQE